MEVYKEIHVDDMKSFYPDDHGQYYEDLDNYEAYQEMTPEEQAEIVPAPTEPDKDDYYFASPEDPVCVKLTFNRPSRICMYGPAIRDQIAFVNTYPDTGHAWMREGNWADAGALMVDGQIVIKPIKGRSPVLYLKSMEGFKVSVYAEP